MVRFLKTESEPNFVFHTSLMDILALYTLVIITLLRLMVQSD